MLVQQHVVRKRLLEVADNKTRLAEPEFAHIKECGECLGVYARFILRLARERAKDKRRKRTTPAL